MVLSRCERPIIVTAKDGSVRQVPCGSCLACQAVKKYSWKKRLDNEFSLHRYGMAFSLTYSDQFLPYVFINSKTGEYHFNKYDFPVESKPLSKDILNDLFNYYTVDSRGFFSVPCFNRDDYKQFFKRLKNYVPEIRYYLQTELGPTTLRSHAHGVIFFDSYDPQTIEEIIISSWQNCDWSLSGNRQSIHLVENASYCTSYVSSYVRLPKLFSFGKFRPFSIKSTFVPLGSQIFSKYIYKDYQCQESDSIAFLNSRTLEYDFLPFLGFHETTYFPKLPYNDQYSSRARVFLLKSYSFFKFQAFGKDSSSQSFTYRLYKVLFENLLNVSETFKSDVQDFLTSESSIYRIYLTSKKFVSQWQGIHPLLRDYCYDRHYYRYEMRRLRLQYEYEEEFCNKRHYSPRYLIYKDPVFVRELKYNYGYIHPNTLQILYNYGFDSVDEFRRDCDRFSLDHNPDVRNYLKKIRDFSDSNHKSHAKNDYFENHFQQKPFYLKNSL